MRKNLYLRQIGLNRALPENTYWAKLPAVQHLAAQPLTLTRPVTLLVGENGVGKSTLIEAIAVRLGFNAEGGTKNFNFATRETHAALYDYLDLGRGPYRPRDGFFLRAESFYNVATNIDELDEGAPVNLHDLPIIARYGGRSLHEQSHGESFLALVRNRLGGQGMYVFDEPEAALSPTSLMELLGHIHRLEQADSQLVIATHSPVLMTYPGAQVLYIDETGIRPVDYRQTSHYQLTRRFLENPEPMYRLLWERENKP